MNPITRTQLDIEAILTQASDLADVPVFSRAKGVTEQDVENALAVLNEGNAKIGACVIVQMPLVDVPRPDQPGPALDMTFVVTVMENPLFNRSENGHNITAEDLALYVLHNLHGRRLQPDIGELYADRQAVEPATDVPQSEVHYNVFFKTRCALDSPKRVATPVFSGTYSALQLSCNTPAASIYTTSDGSYPTPTNGDRFGITVLTESGAVIVTEDGDPLVFPEDLSVTEGTLVRAAAYASGKQGSHAAAFQA